MSALAGPRRVPREGQELRLSVRRVKRGCGMPGPGPAHRLFVGDCPACRAGCSVEGGRIETGRYWWQSFELSAAGTEVELWSSESLAQIERIAWRQGYEGVSVCG